MEITLNHGSGGRISHQLISGLFLKYFNNEILSQLTDSAVLSIQESLLAFTTDSYVIDPIFFPGGNIGKLAICGTVNDLSVSGAVPKYLSVAVVLEEGFSLEELESIIQSMSEEAQKAGVTIVTGDTKVVPRGKGDKIFITTTGIGFIQPEFAEISTARRLQPGDKIIVNGTLGDHAIAILAAREALHFETPLMSDCAALNHLIQAILQVCPEISFMRDITRGGLSTVANELSDKAKLGLNIDESKIPIHESTMGICEIFGFDPLFLANEGKILVTAPAHKADEVVATMRKYPEGKNAAIIGEVVTEHPGQVVLQTITGGKRLLEMPAGVQLPRIC
ncbi:MAG TPA: hydrogenase expression/formation protein HypE [Bacteroidales bacterium]|nr:hydrogenase expression/formation protein HypE [Bacteroidales bacterium]HOK99211.1 hydrogenase expression/formation protein HypE [Bacteroidales bacterium]HPO66064.1 hydrogenase expression/formation protein HypE [Bacteroidales bacterium]